jgi:hypothetical protein
MKLLGIGNKIWIVERHNDEIMPLRLDDQIDTLVSDLISKYKECMIRNLSIMSNCDQFINFRSFLSHGLDFPIPP